MSDTTKTQCVHCGERIYQGRLGEWLHWGTVQRHCEARTVAEPRAVQS
jgi:hypothetical protein